MGNELHFSDTECITKENTAINAIVKTISYFDIFSFPLTLKEIQKFCNAKFSESELLKELELLVEQKKLQKIGDYYIPFFTDKNCIEKRKQDELRATSIQKKVKSYSKIISHFPFVECVCISGSYSKGVIAENGDVDYFIITRPGRLWLSRTLLVLFKKTILLNSRKYFCVNYFIDSDHLEIPDKNIFAATEIKTLIPVYNEALFLRFITINSWTSDMLPNINYQSDQSHFVDKKSTLKHLTEKIFNGSIGEKLDAFCFKLTLKRWKKKFSHFDSEEFDLNMRTRKNVSKHHPQGFQKKVLAGIDERMKKFNLN